jgi:acetyl-CoA carboxylase/biotin carboxylase 1
MKTATAIKDFNGEGLPLMIFANWRGFSGGTRDMVDEVLKFGSDIVDGLVEYKQPVFVYIVPNSQLRGGAWVVVDPTINERYMEMYAAPGGRGNVLEPPGMVSIKFRERDLHAAAHRLDDVLIKLDAQLVEASAGAKADIRTKIKEREVKLLGVYQQIAETFADLHDTPGRMLAKGVIREVVEWKTSRSHFYWRLRRRLAEEGAISKIIEATSVNYDTAKQMLLKNATRKVEDDKLMLQWLAKGGTVESMVSEAKRAAMFASLANFVKADSSGVVEGLSKVLESLDDATKAQLKAQLAAL